jgi:hypothetical protein
VSGTGMIAISPAEYHALLRADFYSFMLCCFTELNPRARFLPNWHIEVLAAKLQAAREGLIKRLIVCIPPRHLKSLAASIALPAWWLGQDPAAAIINVTYGQELSDKFARDCRTIMMSPWYRALFPARLVSPRAALQELVTTQGGFRMATSVNGVVTGRGADVILIDDPLKAADALSEARRQSVNEWYDISSSSCSASTKTTSSAMSWSRKNGTSSPFPRSQAVRPARGRGSPSGARASRRPGTNPREPRQL